MDHYKISEIFGPEPFEDTGNTPRSRLFTCFQLKSFQQDITLMLKSLFHCSRHRNTVVVGLVSRQSPSRTLRRRSVTDAVTLSACLPTVSQSSKRPFATALFSSFYLSQFVMNKTFHSLFSVSSSMTGRLFHWLHISPNN